MDAERYPEFTETGFYKEWLKAEIAFPDQSQEQRKQGLRMALDLYRRVKERWEADQRKSSNGGIGLPS